MTSAQLVIASLAKIRYDRVSLCQNCGQPLRSYRGDLMFILLVGMIIVYCLTGFEKFYIFMGG